MRNPKSKERLVLGRAMLDAISHAEHIGDSITYCELTAILSIIAPKRLEVPEAPSDCGLLHTKSQMCSSTSLQSAMDTPSSLILDAAEGEQGL